ncbi:unnamed protein product [Pleuronectes platessa]|uniref:Uncharacterized protein n=1 Tax=Pleuronectes platessa TaxID=8262 RepID=A0A9N7UH36_PLEPL|nr:unnamed protein product [Pleuronectes platessa]
MANLSAQRGANQPRDVALTVNSLAVLWPPARPVAATGATGGVGSGQKIHFGYQVRKLVPDQAAGTSRGDVPEMEKQVAASPPRHQKESREFPQKSLSRADIKSLEEWLACHSEARTAGNSPR